MAIDRAKKPEEVESPLYVPEPWYWHDQWVTREPRTFVDNLIVTLTQKMAIAGEVDNDEPDYLAVLEDERRARAWLPDDIRVMSASRARPGFPFQQSLSVEPDRDTRPL